MPRFGGKHVLATGGARGIGLGIAQAFGREGARLTLFDVHEDNLAQLAGQKPGADLLDRLGPRT